ncbi:MAG: hypothetical protein COA97_07825 [Flavobacteriales bacterium]|nr:MAG: hypothetical protein COA97_07825 [Flavobacteriales bacterium]
MKKLKIISIILGVIIAIFVLIGIVFSTIYEDKVKAYIVEQINGSINTKIDVKNIEFSVFKKFPYASLEFQEITAEEVTENEKKGTLFSAQSIYLQFNIIDILSENYTIKKVQVEDGMVNVKIDKFGNDNYHFWKKVENTENKLSIELEKLVFKRFNFYFLNEYKGLDMDVEALALSLSGNFSKDNFTLNTQATLFVNQINNKNELVLKNKRVRINTSLAVNQKTKLYRIKTGGISIEQLKFNLAGTIKNKEVGIVLDIHSKGKNLEINELFSLLPAKQREALLSYETVGKITYTSTIKGELSIKKLPAFDANFSIKDGMITERTSDKSLTNLNVTGSFTNGVNNNTSKLTLNQLDADFGAGHISGSFIVTDLSNPYIEFDTKADIDIAMAKEFFKWDSLEVANGNLELNLIYNGYIKELTNIKANELRKLNARGTAHLIDMNLKVKESSKSINNINGSFRFNNNDVHIDTLKFNINNSQFSLDGKFKNLLAFLFVEGEYLAVKTNFHSTKLVLDELLSAKGSSEKNTTYTIALPKNISLSFKANIDTFQFRRFKATNFKGQIDLDDQVLTATNVSFNAMKGHVTGHIAIDASQENKILITSKVNTNEIDIYELFYQFENFGQKQIKAENIKGTTTTNVEFASIFDKQLKVKKDKIYVLADVNIKNGELINYKPILALSKYIEVEELEHIKFKSLVTQIEIKNQTVYIPKTAIKSSALDLTISGTHTFDNKIDYRFKLLMSDVLWRKAKKKKKENSEFGYIEDDGLGRTALFLHMRGTVDDYKISYDTKGLKESWQEGLKKEKTTLKTILNKEFGWFKKDSTLLKEEPTDDGFIIEWEEAEESKDNKKQESKTQNKKTKKKKKKGLGKFIDKIAQPDDDEYEDFDDI